MFEGKTVPLSKSASLVHKGPGKAIVVPEASPNDAEINSSIKQVDKKIYINAWFVSETQNVNAVSHFARKALSRPMGQGTGGRQ